MDKDKEHWTSKIDWQKIAREQQVKEVLDKAAYLVGAAMYEFDPGQDYISQQVQANKMVAEIGADRVDDIIGLVKSGMSHTNIIATLKKSDGGSEFPPP
jgi:hypothetical protein